MDTTNYGQHRTSDHAGLGAALGGMRDRSSSAASDDEQNRPTLRGRAGIFDVMISQHTRLGLRAQPFSHSRIARRLLPCTGLSNRRADRLLPDRPADLPHAAHEGHIGALSFRRSVQFSAALLIGRNPDHLFVGTQAENMRDAGRKGRLRRSPETNGRAKLSYSAADFIRTNYRWGHPEFGGKALAERFHVSPSAISVVVRRKSWAALK